MTYEQMIDSLSDDRLKPMLRNILKGMRHEEALRKAKQCRSNIERTANNG